MRAAAASAIPIQVPPRFHSEECVDVTLLELVDAICEITSDDQEVVATVLHMLSTGRVRLCGNFRGAGSKDLS